MNLVWMRTGKRFTNSTNKRTRIISAIRGMVWHEVKDGLSLPMSPGLGIEALIKELRLPRVSDVAYSHDLAPYSLLGVRTHYKKISIELFAVDTGTGIKPAVINELR